MAKKKKASPARIAIRARNKASQPKKAKVRKERYERYCAKQKIQHAKKKEEGVKMGVREVSIVIGRKQVAIRNDQHKQDLKNARITSKNVPWSITDPDEVARYIMKDGVVCAKIGNKFQDNWWLLCDHPQVARVMKYVSAPK